ncbi:HAD-IIB family hydrolase [Paenibacillus ehimensis]|uniref:HAD-IIB family hydrolase n=1 Tax=Paenibacillus ehimensis TaxID=79264 RepID=UPI00046FEBA2|nr:HAD-IIB family hydrolase [Paenibacillus ehimensis]MEC0212544.1 HAD-IIB family hydrolase [Paenibacillus ehimensis]
MNFIFDMDGTICFKGRPISKNILDCLLELQEAGHFIGFASARPFRDMLPVLDERFHDHLLIGANGAMAHYRGKPLYFNAIPAELAREIVAILDEYQAEYLIDDKLNYALKSHRHHPLLTSLDQNKLAERVDVSRIEAFVKIVVLSCGRFKELAEMFSRLDVTIHYHSAEGILDITSNNVNKMRGLEQTGLGLEPFICLGNDMNDLPLFEKALHSIVIGDFASLLHIAKEQIPVDDRVEQNIIFKLKELSA